MSNLFAKPTLLIPSTLWGKIGALLLCMLLSLSGLQATVIEISACDSTVLFPSQMGTSYTWSDGSMADSLSVSQTDLYWVDIDQGGTIIRDSFQVHITQTVPDFTTSDTLLCGGFIELTPDNPGSDWLIWYDSMAGGNTVFVGDTFRTELLDSTVYYLAGSNAPLDTVGMDTIFTTAQGNYYTIPTERYLEFTANEDFIIHTVQVYVDAADASAIIELRTPSGTVLDTRPVTFPLVGANSTEINFSVSAGTTYRLYMYNYAGADFYIDAPFSFPLIFDELSITGGSFGHYNFFYNWALLKPSCTSQRTPYQVNVLPTPSVELGNDTALCGGSVLLDATFPGATYLWSTGDITPTLSVLATDTVDVQVNLGICEDRDTIAVNIITLPTTPAVQDTALCGGALTLVPDYEGDWLFWYNDTLADSLVFIGDSLNTFLADTTHYLLSATNALPILGGLDSLAGTVQGNYYTIPAERFMSFTSFQDQVLHQVDIYVNAIGATATVELRTASNQTIYTTPVIFTQIGANPISLNYQLEAGTSYRLVLNSLQGAQIHIEAPFSFPFTNETVAITGGTANHYNYFYNWVLLSEDCKTDKVDYRVDITPTPFVNLGPDTLVCGDNFLVDGTNALPGVDYLWSTGDITATLLLTETDTIALETSLNGCASSDSLIVEIVSIPDAPMQMDTVICRGEVLLKPQFDGNYLIWLDAATDSAIAFGDSFATTLFDTASYTLESNSYRTFSAGFASIFNSPSGSYFPIPDERGIFFEAEENITLRTVAIFTDAELTGTIFVRVAGGALLKTIPFAVDAQGRHDISINVALNAGTEYFISAGEMEGGGIFIDLPVAYPIAGEGVTLTGGTFNHYNFFYDWVLTVEGCPSSQTSFEVAVSLPFDLPEYIYSCDAETLSVGNLSGTFSWNTGDMGTSTIADTSGLYILTASNSLGCLEIDTTEVEIPFNAGLPEDGILCGNVLTTNYDTTAIHSWNTGDSTATITISQPGTYTVSVLEPRGCFLTDTINITGFDEFPVLDLGDDQTACDSLTLLSDPANTYLWSTGDTTQDITVFSSGVYTLVIANENGCESRDTTGVFINPSPSANFFLPDTVFSPNLSVSFVNLSTFGSYDWDFGDGEQSTNNSPNHIYADTGSYCVKLIVSDEVNGCGSDTVEKCFVLRRPLTSIQAPELSHVKVYPNPFRDMCRIEYTGLASPVLQWELHDLQGRLWKKGQEQVYTGESISLPLSSLPAGAYHLIWRAGAEAGGTLLIKQ